MKRNRLALALLIVFTAVFGATGFLQQVAATGTPSVPTHQPAQGATQPAAHVRFIVTLAGRASLANLPPAGPAARRAEIVRRLQATAVASQLPLLPLLDQLQSNGHVSRVQPFWISNAIGVSGDAAAMQALAEHPGVTAVRAEALFYLSQPDLASLYEIIAQPLLLDAQQTPLASQTWGITRVRAPYAWHGLGIDGSGVTIAIMDSGVDWLHPDLHTSYRGNLGSAIYQHTGNWFNALDPTSVEPADTLGHGTHVAGTAVGQNGLGVAPGARWIGVAIANPDGTIFESAIHAGFEWLLAPDGDPNLAPQVVNCSWGNNNGAWRALEEDILALQSAGIVPVFAAGNAGPFGGTVGAPASYANSLAVGASDELDEVAWFSARGPSPLTDLPKPHVVAPGARILSTFPGGRYAYASGTSMATPHVAGAVALLLAADPGLTEAEIWQRLAETAVPLSPTPPDNHSGWGRLDAYAALDGVAAGGVLQGVVRQNGQPAAGAILTITTGSGHALPYYIGADGSFRIPLQPGHYTPEVSRFGAVPQSHPPIALALGQTIYLYFDLQSAPTGTVAGSVHALGTLYPITATIRVPGTPVTAVANAQGQYSLTLPVGNYTLLVEQNGYRVGTASVSVQANGYYVRQFLLPPAPTLLLVDGGGWYYQSHIAAYQQALAQRGYYADLWRVRSPYDGTPPASVLAHYDSVIWSDPQRAPGYIGADGALSQYLLAGGTLLVSGQNVGLFDGSTIFASYWWIGLLRGQYRGKFTERPLPPIQAAANGPFAGLQVQLAETGSTAQFPDRTRPPTDRVSSAPFTYANGDAASLQAGLCSNFRIVYLGFGLEGVTDETTRGELVQRSLDFFQSPRQQVGTAWLTDAINDYAVPGQATSYELTLLNLSEVLTDTFQIYAGGEGWQNQVLTQTMTMGPCSAMHTRLTIETPATAARGMTHTVWITAVSTLDPAISATLQVRQQVPNRVLLVDDDRWYDYQPQYRAALDALQMRYDVWESEGLGEIKGRGSPPLTLLQQYDFIFWFTGYDWFEPLTAQERASLETYLRGGGRLFLSSQDYLYYHSASPFTRNYLGVGSYYESVTPTHVYAGEHPALPALPDAPHALTFGKAKNNGDGIIPAPHSRAIAWNEQGTAVALATEGPNWRTIFWSVPFEFLTDTVRLAGMQGMAGWLSDLGDSTFVADARQGRPGETHTFTLTLHMLPYATGGAVTVTNTLPPGVTLVQESALPEMSYNAPGRTITWYGRLAPGETRQFVYRARLDEGLTPGSYLENRVTLRSEGQEWAFTRAAALWITPPDGAPDLSQARLTLALGKSLPLTVPLSLRWVTYTLTLPNIGARAAGEATAVLHILPPLSAYSHTLTVSHGTAVFTETGQALRVEWQGEVAPATAVTLTVAVCQGFIPFSAYVGAAAFVDDGVQPLVRSRFTHLLPNRLYLPVVPAPEKPPP